MFDIFKKERGASARLAERPPRHSRGWIEVRSYLESAPSLRVLDFGATSPANINYLTSRGHSVYMANMVQDATRPEWLKPAQDSEDKNTSLQFDTDGFLAANLEFSGRDFDVILLWDTVNYLPPEMVPALFDRLRQVLRPDGLLLAFFHGRLSGPETAYARFQLSDGDELIVHDGGSFPVRKIYQTRQLEKFLEGFSNARFFLDKDNVREVIVYR
jgi:SAM-dependent methyltransferase